MDIYVVKNIYIGTHMSKSLGGCLGGHRTKGIQNRGTKVHTSNKKYSRIKVGKLYNCEDNMSGGHFRHFQSTLKKEAELLKEEVRENKPEFSEDTRFYLEYVQFIMDTTTSLIDEADWLYSGRISEESFVEAVHNLRKSINTH
jgi:hypothetical protein